MSLALFDLDELLGADAEQEWTPVYHPPTPDETADLDTIDKAAWKAWTESLRCRDCGSVLAKVSTGSSCGGAGREGSYDLCDNCAGLDECRLVCCTPLIERRPRSNFTTAELAHCDCGWFLLDRTEYDDDFNADDIADVLAAHARPRHVSRWGMNHPADEHDRLAAIQQRARTKYRKALAA